MFNWFEPEYFYIGVRVVRFTGHAPSVVHVDPGERTDAESCGTYCETIFHIHRIKCSNAYAKGIQVEMVRKLLTQEWTSKIKCDFRVHTWLSDEDAYDDYCQGNIEFEALMESICG